MKKTTLFFTVFVFFLVSSCIPSLHSIVSDKNRVTDDRLVGDWKMEEDIFDDATINFEFSVESDDKEDRQEGIKMMKELGEDMKGVLGKKKKNSLWKFERAAIITAKEGTTKSTINNKKITTDATATFHGGALSMVPENWTIIEKEDLPFYILTYKKSDDTKQYMKAELTKIKGALYIDFYPYSELDESRFGINSINAHTFAKVEIKEGKLLLHSFNLTEIEGLLKTKKIRLKHETITNATIEEGKIVYDDYMVLTASTEELRAFIAKYSDNEDLFEDAEELTAYNEKNP